MVMPRLPAHGIHLGADSILSADIVDGRSDPYKTGYARSVSFFLVDMGADPNISHILKSTLMMTILYT